MIPSGNPATNSGFPAGGYYGTNIPGPFTSSDDSGALTFVFRSESSFTYTGWVADVTCGPLEIEDNLSVDFNYYPNLTNNTLMVTAQQAIDLIQI